MLSRHSSTKVRPEHLDRPALIYVRQSSPTQVRDHTASTARQYDLAQYAEQLGWPKQRIQVIDQDQGLSGTSALGRDGFHCCPPFRDKMPGTAEQYECPSSGSSFSTKTTFA